MGIMDKSIVSYAKMTIDFSENMKIIDCDSGFSKLFGFSLANVQAKKLNLLSIISKEELDKVRPIVLAKLKKESGVFLPVMGKNKFGEELSLEVYIELNTNPDNGHTEGKIIVANYQENASNVISGTIINQIPAGIALISADDNIIVKNANEEFYKILGYLDEQDFMIFNGENFAPLISEQDYECLRVRFSMAISQGDSFEYKMRIKSDKKPEGIWIQMKAKFLEKTVTSNHFQVYINDITERTKLELELHSLTERQQNTAIPGEIIFKYDCETDRVTIPMRDLLGNNQESIMEHFFEERKWAVFVAAEDQERFQQFLDQTQVYPETGELVFRTKIHEINEDDWYKVYYRNNASPDSKATTVVGRIVNITSEKLSENSVASTLRHDSITGFYNYHNFEKAVTELLHNRTTRHSALIIINIKNLFEMTREYGTMFSDTVIQNISRKFYTLLRKTDILGRLTQDTFAIWIRNVDSEIVYSKAKELCGSISNINGGLKDNLCIESCGGVAEEDGDADFETMLLESYSAMIYAKEKENKCIIKYSQQIPLAELPANRFDNEIYYNIENYDVDMLSFAFGLLLNSTDLDDAINILLERIGRRYELDDVVITSKGSCIEDQYVSHRWSKELGIVPAEKLQNAAAEMLFKNTDYFDKKGMFVISESKNEDWSRAFKDSGYVIRSMVGCGYYIDSKLEGFIGFIDEYDNRDWSEYIRGTFYEMVNIITVFLSINKKRKEQNKCIENLEDTDRLTGLTNIAGFRKKAKEFINNINSGQRAILIVTDINNFAYFNDTYGFVAGDNVLKDFADFLKGFPNVSCRIYSDYFVAITNSKTEFESCDYIANRNDIFEKQIKEKYPLSNIQLSTGVFEFLPGECNLETAIDNANMARKVCKSSNGVGCLAYNEDMRIEREREQGLTGGMKMAIKNREFHMYLQPKFSLDSKEVIGAEALTRWITPDNVVHLPEEFIAVFEKQGNILEMDMYIYEQVLINMKKWMKEGRKMLPVSVNFSRLHSIQDKFVDELYKLTLFYEVPTNLIEIEITEGAISTTSDRMLLVLNDLRKRGFLTAMDDFGTGMSSLSTLLEAPIDIVKVDKEFLYSALEQNNEEYIKHLGGLITAAGKDIIFEGVETEEQAKFLLDCGYKKAQGFLFSKAIAPEEFEEKYL